MPNIVQVVVTGASAGRPTRTLLNVGETPATIDATPNRTKTIVHNNGPSTIELTLGQMTLRVLRGSDWQTDVLEDGPLTARVVSDA
ncbi:MAG TPA: hypothetical protein VGL60_06590 [Acidimicrobiales bacterium]